MNFSIPIYIQEHKEPASKRVSYSLRPLFFDQPVEHAQSLSRGMAELVKGIRKKLGSLADCSSHQELAQWTYCPEMDIREVWVSVMPKRTGIQSRFPVVLLPMFDRQLACVPSVAGLWFERNAREDLALKTEEVLREHFRDKEHEGEESDMLEGQLTGKASLTTIELEVNLPTSWKTEKVSLLNLLGGRKRLSGREELENVGHCLDWEYPDGLQRATQREKLVEVVLSLWQHADRRSIMLVGPRQGGKTSVLHECIFRRRADPSFLKKYYLSETTWHVSPQRLIAGMSYVGQWEERWLAILEWCRAHRIRLHLDDVLGLFYAGVSSCSNLCLADVLKPFIERREVSVIAEITPEALQRLQERDRGFADLFQILPVPETSELDTLSILLAQRRELEDRHGCQFSLESISLITDLQRRYVQDAAFPGKAAQMMKQLAAVKIGQKIGRDDVLDAFQRSSGLSLNFLNDRVKLRRFEVVKGIRATMIGQTEAVEAAADVICVAKARLNETGKPLGCFLFLGPTGVGKTQCAKAIAGYLFSDPERLIRLNLNEYIGADAVGRLVGTLHQPEGILTSAIRRQPFSVVLLDEVEKANPEVLDLLLQVLGEARLTDTLGRTADFSNAIIVLTSNLGATEAGRSMGFHRDSEQIALSYRKAAEQFFRPEFFNRLDRVIPFGALALAEIENISGILLQQLRDREGLRRWRCELRVSEDATRAIIDRGFDPQLGARALKRAIERELAHPIGVHLAAMKPGNPGVIRVLGSGNRLVVQPNELVFAERIVHPKTRTKASVRLEVERLAETIGECSAQLEQRAPSKRINPALLDPKEGAFFATQRQLFQTRELLQDVRETLEQVSFSDASFSALPSKVGRRRSLKPTSFYSCPGKKLAIANLLAEDSMRDFLRELERSPRPDSLFEQVEQLWHETTWLKTMVRGCAGSENARVLLILFGAGPKDHESDHYSPLNEIVLTKEAFELCGLDCDLLNEGKLVAGPRLLMAEEQYATGLVFQGPGAFELASVLAGTHLKIHADNRMQLRQSIAFGLKSVDSPECFAKAQLASHAEWLAHCFAPDASQNLGDDPLSFGPITTLIDYRTQTTMDLPTGLLFRKIELSPEEMRQIALTRLAARYSARDE
jgi:ATP-dependent Clp protease ATP-binding subunit ClpC